MTQDNPDIELALAELNQAAWAAVDASEGTDKNRELRRIARRVEQVQHDIGRSSSGVSKAAWAVVLLPLIVACLLAGFF